MFAKGSLIFQMEQGAKTELSVDRVGTLNLPEIRTDNQGIDAVIRRAWLGQYSRTSQMQDHLTSIDTNIGRDAHNIETRSESAELLRERIRKWRERRECKFAKNCLFNNSYSNSLRNDQDDAYHVLNIYSQKTNYKLFQIAMVWKTTQICLLSIIRLPCSQVNA